jgi:hypothetical protein
MAVRPSPLRGFTVQHVELVDETENCRKHKTNTKFSTSHDDGTRCAATTCIHERTVSFFNYIVSCSEN